MAESVDKIWKYRMSLQETEDVLVEHTPENDICIKLWNLAALRTQLQLCNPAGSRDDDDDDDDDDVCAVDKENSFHCVI